MQFFWLFLRLYLWLNSWVKCHGLPLISLISGRIVNDLPLFSVPFFYLVFIRLLTAHQCLHLLRTLLTRIIRLIQLLDRRFIYFSYSVFSLRQTFYIIFALDWWNFLKSVILIIFSWVLRKVLIVSCRKRLIMVDQIDERHFFNLDERICALPLRIIGMCLNKRILLFYSSWPWLCICIYIKSFHFIFRDII